MDRPSLKFHRQVQAFEKYLRMMEYDKTRLGSVEHPNHYGMLTQAVDMLKHALAEADGHWEIAMRLNGQEYSK